DAPDGQQTLNQLRKGGGDVRAQRDGESAAGYAAASVSAGGHTGAPQATHLPLHIYYGCALSWRVRALKCRTIHTFRSTSDATALQFRAYCLNHSNCSRRSVTA